MLLCQVYQVLLSEPLSEGVARSARKEKNNLKNLQQTEGLDTSPESNQSGDEHIEEGTTEE